MILLSSQKYVAAYVTLACFDVCRYVFYTHKHVYKYVKYIKCIYMYIRDHFLESLTELCHCYPVMDSALT